MAQYETLKSSIQSVIKQNGTNAITGDILQQSLLAMINSLGADYQFAGVATQSTDPGTPDQNVFYLAGPGTYTNFSGLVVPGKSLGILKYDGSWSVENINFAVFNGEIGTAEQLAQTITPGIYRGIAPTYQAAMFFVNVYNTTNVLQGRVTLTSAGTIIMERRLSTDGGTNWGPWGMAFDMFSGNIGTAEQLAQTTTTGVYRGVDPTYPAAIFLVCDYGNVIVQARWTTTTSGISQIEVRTSTDGGTTWAPWGLQQQAFSGAIGTAQELAQAVETGVYRGIGPTYPSAIFLVRDYGTFIIQTRWTTTQSGDSIIEKRKSTDGGTNWTPWENAALSSSLPGIPSISGGCVYVNRPNYTVISDSLKWIGTENCNWVIDRKRGIAYCTYSPGNDNYYENVGKIGLCVFSLRQAFMQEHYIVGQDGDLDANGNSIGDVFVSNICQVDDTTIRCFLGTRAGGTKMYYRDFNTTSKTFGAIYAIRCLSGGTLVDATTTLLQSFITSQGYSQPNLSGLNVRGRLNTDIQDDGFRYALFDVYEGIGYQVVCRSEDNWTTMEFYGVIPYPIQYEAAITKAGSVWYIVYRVEGGKMMTTTEDFITYTTPVSVDDLSCRPDIFTFNNMLHIVSGYSSDSGDGFKRKTLQLLRGTGNTISAYTKIVDLFDEKGIQYPMVHLFGNGQYALMCYGTSPVGLDAENGYYNMAPGNPRYRGKTSVVFYSVLLGN